MEEPNNAVLGEVVAILEDMTADWDMESDTAITGATRLVADLGFESIDIVQFIVAVEEHFRRRGLPWEEFLMHDGRYRDEITVAEAARFLATHLQEG